jgi:phenylacetate-CoA ligase
MYRALRSYRAIFSGQWSDRQRTRRTQAQKLRRLLEHAYKTVPYYRKLFDEAGIVPAQCNSLDDLRRIPVTSKATLRQSEPRDLISTDYRPRDLEPDCSSGSTGTPFTVHLDKDYVLNRNLRFLRGLRAVGYRPGDKLLLITDRHGSKGKSWMRWKQVSLEEPADRLLETIDAYRPDVLYGFGAPLRQLAERITATGYRITFPIRIIWTAETLDSVSRHLVEIAFATRIFDFYGMTEMGLVAWECPAHSGYHLSEESVIVEYVPVDGSGNARKMVMTNLDLYSMPLIRFDSGDLGVQAPDETCACGRSLARLERVEGRVIDCIKLPGGETLSTYLFICQFEILPGVRRFQIVQDGDNHITISIDAATESRPSLDREIPNIMRRVAGNRLAFTIHYCDTIAGTDAGKFRAVRSLVG